MFQSMQPSDQAQPSPGSPSFAGLLAAIAAPALQKPDAGSVGDESDLGDDILTLSYERALRTHARYRPPHRDDLPPAATLKPDLHGTWEPASPAEKSDGEDTTVHMSDATDCDLRTAIVTIRLSKAESLRLRQRAAEAGVTVSAFLRSCAFEVEALRAEVKKTVAEMRSAAEGGGKGSSEQGSNELERRTNAGVELTRTLGHIGNLWIGLRSGKVS